jgi:hypothetical protein
MEENTEHIGEKLLLLQAVLSTPWHGEDSISALVVTGDPLPIVQHSYIRCNYFLNTCNKNIVFMIFAAANIKQNT